MNTYFIDLTCENSNIPLCISFYLLLVAGCKILRLFHVYVVAYINRSSRMSRMIHKCDSKTLCVFYWLRWVYVVKIYLLNLT